MSHNLVVPTAPDRTRVLGAMPLAASINASATPDLFTAFQRADLQRDNLSGVLLGPYELGAKLGEGGMGTLYRGLHQQLGKACAVKFIHPTMSTNGQAIARFLQEIQAVGQLNHPHIVCALDAGCCQGVHYYVTELLQGEDLQRLVSTTGPMTIEKSCSIIRQILDALAHAHERGFVHRDIKPSNIFLTEDGHAKLLDFGLARNTQQASDGLTSSEQLLGTLDYLAPEQAENATQANAASDIYSLGLTWIYVLSAQSPFPDAQYSTMVSKLRGQMIDQPAWFVQNASSLPTQLRELLSAMIAKDPRARLNDCREAIARLDGCVTRRHGHRHTWIASSALTVAALAVLAYTAFVSTSAAKQEQSKIEQTTSQQVIYAPIEETTKRQDSATRVEVTPKSNADDDRPLTETVQTLSSTKSTANAKAVRRVGASKGSPTASQTVPYFNNKQ